MIFSALEQSRALRVRAKGSQRLTDTDRRHAVLGVITPAPTLDVVIPVHNEEDDLAVSVRRLHAYLRDAFPFSARITIADNASTDATWMVTNRLADELPNVRALHLNEKGRGRALAAAWLTSDATVVAYMDVDLSTDLSGLLPLVAPILSGHSDVSIGSRLARGARVVRGMKRELISRGYNLLLRLTLGVGFRDAQCGFKAVRADVARRLLPTVRNRNWFFDTELLVRAERAGYRVHELPVDWVDDPNSRVDIVATAIEDLRGIWRLATGRFRQLEPSALHAPARIAAPRLRGQLARFAVIGLGSTLAYAVIYWALRGFLAATFSNSVALLITAIGNTAANRRLTFGIKGSERLVRDHAGGLIAFGMALVLTNLSIILLSAAAPAASHSVEIAVLTAVNATATLARFLVLRSLLFHLRARRVSAR